MTQHPLKHLIRTGADHELSAKELEAYSDMILLTAYNQRNTMKILSINKARISLELANRKIHPTIKAISES